MTPRNGVSDFCRAKTDVRRNKEDKRTDIPPTAPTSSSLSLVLAPGMSKGKGRSGQSQLDTMVFFRAELRRGEEEKSFSIFFLNSDDIYREYTKCQRNMEKKIYLITNFFLRNECYIERIRLLGKFFGGIKERYLCLDPSSREREMEILRSGRHETFTHERRKIKLYNEYNSNDGSLWN